MKYPKSSYSKFMKKLRISYENNSSLRNPQTHLTDRLTHREFKLVLPMIPRDNVSGKGSSLKPEYQCVESMNLMINCLKLNDYNESQCGNEINNFLACYNQYNIELKTVMEEAKKGIYKITENQSKYPIKFMQKMLAQYKTPRKVDNGPDIPMNSFKPK